MRSNPTLGTRKPCFLLIKKKNGRGHPSALFTSNESSSPHLSPLEILLHFDVKRVKTHCDFNYSNSTPFICKRSPSPSKNQLSEKIHCLSFQWFIRDAGREAGFKTDFLERIPSTSLMNSQPLLVLSAPNAPFPNSTAHKRRPSLLKPSPLEGLSLSPLSFQTKAEWLSSTHFFKVFSPSGQCSRMRKIPGLAITDVRPSQ